MNHTFQLEAFIYFSNSGCGSGFWFRFRFRIRISRFSIRPAKVDLTSDSFAQPKQHVQCLVFPRLQRQMSRNLLEDEDTENTKRSTKVAEQIWKDFLLEKNVEKPSEKRDLALILKSFYVDARKKDGSSYSLGSLKTLRFALN